MPVVLLAVAEYVTVPALWHLSEVLPASNAKEFTIGVMVTVWFVTVGPLQPEQ